MVLIMGGTFPDPIAETDSSLSIQYPVEAGQSLSHESFHEREPRNAREKHDYLVDGITEQSLLEMEGRGIDLILRDFAYRDNPYTAPESDNNKTIRGAPDLVLLDADRDLLAVYEAKINPDGNPNRNDDLDSTTETTAYDQLYRFKRSVESINEAFGTSFDVTGHEIDDFHVNEEYMEPDKYQRGAYWTELSRQKMEEDVPTQVLLNHLWEVESFDDFDRLHEPW